MQPNLNLEQEVYWLAKKLFGLGDSLRLWIVPQVKYFEYVADFMVIPFSSGNIIEIEIKSSWHDYQKDKNKKSWVGRYKMGIAENIKLKEAEKYYNRCKNLESNYKDKFIPPIQPLTKYDWLLGNYPMVWKPNVFIYAAPLKLATQISSDKERKTVFGVWGMDLERGNHVVYHHAKSFYTINSISLKIAKEEIAKRCLNFVSDHFSSEERKRK